MRAWWARYQLVHDVRFLVHFVVHPGQLRLAAAFVGPTMMASATKILRADAREEPTHASSSGGKAFCPPGQVLPPPPLREQHGRRAVTVTPF